ncbi:MAG: lysophospholipase [Anaerolineales bacterium]
MPETLSTPDGLTLHVYHWPVPEPQGAVLLMHGLSEHLGRYDHVARALNAAGLAVWGADHRGHGRSTGEPRGHVHAIPRLADDQALLWARMKAAHPDIPRFVIGHSMGGNVATHFALRHQDEMRGLVTSGAGLILNVSGVLVPTVRLLAGVAPLASSPSSLPSSTLSHDPEVVRAYDDDPLVYHGNPRFGTIQALIAGGQDALQRAESLHIPLLIMHGSADELVPARASQALYGGASSADKTLKVYPELYHEIFNETDKAAVLADLTAWLQAHL